MTEEVMEREEQFNEEEFEKDFLEGFNDGDDIEETEEPDEEEDEEEITEDDSEKSEDGEEEPPDEEEEAEPEEKEEEPPEEEPKEEKEEEAEPEKQKEEEKPPEPLKVFFMGKEIEIPKDDVKNLVQKGLNHDRMETKLRQIEEEFKYVDQFLDMAAYYDIKPDELIKHAIEGYQNHEISKFTEKNIPEDEAKELFNQRLSNAKTARANQPKPKGKDRDMKQEIDELFNIRPDLKGMKEFPKEVALDIQKGVDVKTAYMKHEVAKHKAENETLNAKIKELESKLKVVEQEKKVKNAPKKQKGAGSGSTKTDPFLKGFLDDDF